MLAIVFADGAAQAMLQALSRSGAGACSTGGSSSRSQGPARRWSSSRRRSPAPRGASSWRRFPGRSAATAVRRSPRSAPVALFTFCVGVSALLPQASLSRAGGLFFDAKVRGAIHPKMMSARRAVFDYKYTNSEGTEFGKLVFLSWCAPHRTETGRAFSAASVDSPYANAYGA